MTVQRMRSRMADMAAARVRRPVRALHAAGRTALTGARAVRPVFRDLYSYAGGLIGVYHRTKRRIKVELFKCFHALCNGQ